MNPEFSIVIPVYKNAATLPELYARLTQAIQELSSCEILFVNDACPQGSLNVLRDLARRDKRIAVLVFEKNLGQNRAVMAGLAYARGEVVVVMDADLQDPPEAIPCLLKTLRQGERAAVFAGRRGRYESLFRSTTSGALKLLMHIFSRRRIPADAGLFVAMRREIVERLIAFRDPDPYLIGLMGRTGLPLLSIPVVRPPNPYNTSAYTSWMRLRLAWRALVTTVDPLYHLFSIHSCHLFSIHSCHSKPPSLIGEYIGARFAGECIDGSEGEASI